MYSSYMQGGINSAISPDESTKPDDSKTLLFVPDTPLGLELWASKSGNIGKVVGNHAYYAGRYELSDLMKAL